MSAHGPNVGTHLGDDLSRVTTLGDVQRLGHTVNGQSDGCRIDRHLPIAIAQLNHDRLVEDYVPGVTHGIRLANVGGVHVAQCFLIDLDRFRITGVAYERIRRVGGVAVDEIPF